MSSSDWICEAQLGSGGFGIVHVWRNKITNQKYALKKCKFAADNLMTSRHKAQWSQEVDIMLRLDHINVVKCYTIPSGLDPGTPDLPSLCMEFCESGDLRRLLNRAENCRGLTESQILPILNDVASALGYLHNRRIIHRDLKPENVVLKGGSESRIIYKLIDLGYAKELGVSSLAKSFVGTLQYVAPELFLEHDYTKSVDYWSLGLLCYEIVTGQRPFLPHLSPGQWVDHVEQKKEKHIAIIETVDGKIQYLENIVPETRISSRLAHSLEEWLSTLLDWNSERRGRNTEDQVSVFNQLNRILREKRLEVFSMKTRTVHSFTSEQSFSFTLLQTQIAAELKISVEHQLLLTEHGYRITREDDLDQFTEAEVPVFIVDLSADSLNVSQQLKCIQLQIPLLVQLFLRDTKRNLQDYHQKLMYIHGYHFIAQENSNHKLFCIGLRTLYAYLNNIGDEVNNSNFAAEFIKLKSKLDFFSASLKHDLARYEDQASKKDRITSTRMIESWQLAKSDMVAGIDTIQSRICILEESIKSARMKIKEIKSNPLIVEQPGDPTFQEFEQSSLKLYDVLRRERPSTRSNTTPREIAQIAVRMLRRRDQLLNKSCALLAVQRHLLKDVEDIKAATAVINSSMAKAGNSLNKAQFRRQSDVWTLLAAAIKYTPHQTKESENSIKHGNSPNLNNLDQTENCVPDPSEADHVIEENEKLRNSLEQRMKILETVLTE